MLVLDTNHLTELERGQAGKGMQLMQRLHDFRADSATTVITVEEQLAGRIAQIRSHRELHDLRKRPVSLFAVSLFAVVGLAFRVEVTDDLAVWRSGAAEFVTLEDTPARPRVRDATPVSAAMRRFHRLVVTAP